MSPSVLNELQLLQKSSSAGIVSVKDVVFHLDPQNKFNIILVFDYFEHDLLGLVSKKVSFEFKFVKNILLQICNGLQEMHRRQIFHRDLKTSNILMNNRGLVVITDLGLAIQLKNGQKLHKPSSTLLYRAPEQLFGLKEGYNFKADIWSLGCVLAELMLGVPLFLEAKNFNNFVELMLKRFGKKLAQVDQYRASKLFNEHQHCLDPDSDVKNFFLRKKPEMDPCTLDLLCRMLEVDPDKRIDIEGVMRHPFFKTEPLPAKDFEMPKIEKHCHEFTLKKEYLRKKKKLALRRKLKQEKKLGFKIDKRNSSSGSLLAKRGL